MSQSPQRPVSTWSRSICRKIPESRRISTVANALWILRNPIRLTPLEKVEILCVVKTAMKDNRGYLS